MSTFETDSFSYPGAEYVPDLPVLNPSTGVYEYPADGKTNDIEGKVTEGYPTIFDDWQQFPGPVNTDETI